VIKSLVQVYLPNSVGKNCTEWNDSFSSCQGYSNHFSNISAKGHMSEWNGILSSYEVLLNQLYKYVSLRAFVRIE
jgi:hypothetical protein